MKEARRGRRHGGQQPLGWKVTLGGSAARAQTPSALPRPLGPVPRPTHLSGSESLEISSLSLGLFLGPSLGRTGSPSTSGCQEKGPAPSQRDSGRQGPPRVGEGGEAGAQQGRDEPQGRTPRGPRGGGKGARAGPTRWGERRRRSRERARPHLPPALPRTRARRPPQLSRSRYSRRHVAPTLLREQREAHVVADREGLGHAPYAPIGSCLLAPPFLSPHRTQLRYGHAPGALIG